MSAAKITYVNLTADNEEVHGAIDAAFAAIGPLRGRHLPNRIAGADREAATLLTSTSPHDTRVAVAHVAAASTADVDDAVRAARGAFPAWRRTPWPERVSLVQKAAQLFRQRKFELCAWLILEMGKNRVEALGEIEETADLLDYYAEDMRRHDGYQAPMGRLSPADSNTSSMRPFGAWAVIAPWNFPYALMAAPAAAALLAGNTVVMKPSSETPLSGLLVCGIFEDAGLPPGTVSCLAGSGRVVGEGLAGHPGVDGLTFTGSYDVGFGRLWSHFSRDFPKPCVVEMGGKNPAIVMDSADLDRAVTGVFRSAFGMNGHKCSACSRVYVHERIAAEFTGRLVEAAEGARIGDPAERTTFLGPLATRASLEDYRRFSDAARALGAVRSGGEVLGDGAFAHGYYARPTVLAGVPNDNPLVRDELFVPMVAVQGVASLDEALQAANDTRFGLTAGFFSTRQAEIDQFLDRIEAGVVYVNRAAGATTGAWPGVQPFGGWKGSGSTGKNIGGPYTLPCYMREQSRTLTS